MQNNSCTNGGHETPAETIWPTYDQTAVNDDDKPQREKPPPPPETANWVIEPIPPEVADYFTRTFDEAAFLAEMEEALKTGGADIDALLARIDRRINGRP